MFRKSTTTTAAAAFLLAGLSLARVWQEEPEHLRVLFIGNSLTETNDLPYHFEFLANRGGERRVEAEAITVDGATLEQHWKARTALEKIHDGRWDVVVLQEQGMLGGDIEAFYLHVKLFHREIQVAGAKTVLYLPLPRREPAELAQRLTRAYMTIGKELEVPVVPVTLALDEVPAVLQAGLYESDGIHPSVGGTHLAGCLLYATLFDESPVGRISELEGFDVRKTHPGVVSGANRSSPVLDIQRAAWETYQKLKKAGGYIFPPERPPFRGSPRRP